MMTCCSKTLLPFPLVVLQATDSSNMMRRQASDIERPRQGNGSGGGGGEGGEQPSPHVVHAMRGFFRSISLGQNQPVANVLQVHMLSFFFFTFRLRVCGLFSPGLCYYLFACAWRARSPHLWS